MCVRKTAHKGLVLIAIALPVLAAADDLDAALEAQKKASQRRVYSENAVLGDQNLTVPRAVSAEERDLDRRLRESDARADSRPSLAPAPFNPVPAATPQPAQNRNWLTPALLDETAALSTAIEAEEDWVARELDRQRDLRVKESDLLLKEKENEKVDRALRESSTRPMSILPELDRLREFQSGPQNITASGPGVPAYSTPQKNSAGLAARPSRREISAPSSQPYSTGLPESSPATSGRALRAPLLSPYDLQGSGPGSSASSGLSPDWNARETAPLTPVQMIRKSAPINRPDPFKDDYMPRMKGSIWE